MATQNQSFLATLDCRTFHRIPIQRNLLAISQAEQSQHQLLAIIFSSLPSRTTLTTQDHESIIASENEVQQSTNEWSPGSGWRSQEQPTFARSAVDKSANTFEPRMRPQGIPMIP
ncbi:hypothetical protein HYFRA_00012065 [Hymenoscyphus fraxineus]|uniref:Uncharacterized protein n=1 Tax=Hymenoscyphus fraxineus TaxID=746836 RepID=A0A9N9L0P7_9HELO|nr:hypothetical protein HYFRA_00012065 [Hymenoscyphus fraxineus]